VEHRIRIAPRVTQNLRISVSQGKRAEWAGDDVFPGRGSDKPLNSFDSFNSSVGIERCSEVRRIDEGCSEGIGGGKFDGPA
jgi:hypothetical protein